ncbi:hypothetical protein B0H14DRAFT_2638231 [Mycena olivaceomarginata]|nr:hypothetical protein B0H14DRAFT_2638231 [Mycena olivaceomarginata]
MSVGNTNCHSNASEPPNNIQVIIADPTSFTNPVPSSAEATIYGTAKYGTVPYTYGHNFCIKMANGTGIFPYRTVPYIRITVPYGTVLIPSFFPRTANIYHQIMSVRSSCSPMAKENAKQHAAANREAAKQNKPLPLQNVPQDDTSIVTDPNYMEHDSETNDSEPEAISQSLQAGRSFPPLAPGRPLRAEPSPPIWVLQLSVDLSACIGNLNFFMMS